MKVTKLVVSSHQGPNKTPGSGYVTFDDGKDYMFSWDPIDQTWSLSGHVRMAGTLVLKGIHSPKRVDALKDHLNA